MEPIKTQDQPMTKAEPQKEHEWLHKFIGEWTFEADSPDEQAGGSESVRSLGGLWIIAEGESDMPGGGTANTLMTLGYDPQKNRFVGTWVGSMMTHIWVYDGSLDASERVLTLDAEGPSFEVQGKTTKYKDVFEFKSDDHRTLTGHMLGEDGEWRPIMQASYHRKK